MGGPRDYHVCLVVQSCPTLRHHGLQPTRLLCPWDSPGKNARVCCHAFLQGIFPTQGSNPGLPHCRQILYHLSHQGSPRILSLKEKRMKIGQKNIFEEVITGNFPNLVKEVDFYLKKLKECHIG